ncbi:hypothetical protein SVAN01_01705 [Stagonosporopsis vannaccii]|nr:hypothetical protein SVAN01_01705 [Stagonosporopsis vannaccii]
MASTSPETDDELPMVWLGPPPALSPSNHPIAIYPLPLTISATLASLIILVLIIMYHRKTHTATSPPRSIEIATLRDNIRIIRSRTTTQPTRSSPRMAPDHNPPTTHDTEVHHPEDNTTAKDSVNIAANEDSSGTSASQDTISVEDYHSYLKDNIHGPSLRKVASNRSLPSLGYTGPSHNADLGTSNDSVKDTKVRVTKADVVRTVASSDYSISIGPTPLPSRQNSFRGGQGYGAWTRLRLGLEYDSDRTFVPSEASLRLGAGDGIARSAWL